MNLVHFAEIISLRDQVLNSNVTGLAESGTQKHRRRTRVLVMRQPFRSQHSLRGAADVVRVKEGNNFETLSYQEGRAIHNRRRATGRNDGNVVGQPDLARSLK